MSAQHYAIFAYLQDLTSGLGASSSFRKMQADNLLLQNDQLLKAKYPLEFVIFLRSLKHLHAQITQEVHSDTPQLELIKT